MGFKLNKANVLTYNSFHFRQAVRSFPDKLLLVFSFLNTPFAFFLQWVGLEDPRLIFGVAKTKTFIKSVSQPFSTKQFLSSHFYPRYRKQDILLQMFFNETFRITWQPPAAVTSEASSSRTGVTLTSSDVILALLPAGVLSEPSAHATDERVDRAGVRRGKLLMSTVGWTQCVTVLT